MILKECPRCKRLMPYGKRYCSECEPIVEKMKEEQRKARGRVSSKGYAQQNKKYIQFYKSKEWKMLSQKKLQDTQYKCECCGKLATEVHHIDPIQKPSGWERRLDYDNLMSVCVICHNGKHGRYQKKNKKNESKMNITVNMTVKIEQK